jgi:hypothetical protein
MRQWGIAQMTKIFSLYFLENFVVTLLAYHLHLVINLGELLNDLLCSLSFIWTSRHLNELNLIVVRHQD